MNANNVKMLLRILVGVLQYLGMSQPKKLTDLAKEPKPMQDSMTLRGAALIALSLAVAVLTAVVDNETIGAGEWVFIAGTAVGLLKVVRGRLNATQKVAPTFKKDSTVIDLAVADAKKESDNVE